MHDASQTRRVQRALLLTGLYLADRSYAQDNCYYNGYSVDCGNDSDTLSYAAKTGIGIAIFAAIICAFFAIFTIRRKHRRTGLRQQYGTNTASVIPAYYPTHPGQQQHPGQYPLEQTHNGYYGGPNQGYTNYGPDAAQWQYDPNNPNNPNLQSGVLTGPPNDNEAPPKYEPPAKPPPGHSTTRSRNVASSDTGTAMMPALAMGGFVGGTTAATHSGGHDGGASAGGGDGGGGGGGGCS